MGAEHPSLAAPLNNLALLYEARGRYEEAESLYKRSLAIALKALGPGHPNVKKIRDNLKRFNASKAQNAVQIIKCVNGSQAEKAGLQKNDVIITYDDVRIKNTQELIRAVKQKADREKVAILIVRDRQPMRFTMQGGQLGVHIENAALAEAEIKKYLQKTP